MNRKSNRPRIWTAAARYSATPLLCSDPDQSGVAEYLAAAVHIRGLSVRRLRS